MKRHAALADLARDHFHALVCAQNIRKAQTPQELAQAGAEMVKLWNEDLIDHFQEEEEVLLPVLSRYGPPSENPDVRQMLDDHAFLRDGLRRLEAGLAARRDCRELTLQLGRRLDQHARLEDRVIFGFLESTLSDEDLADVARLSRTFREQRSRPLGPQKSGPPACDARSARGDVQETC